MPTTRSRTRQVLVAPFATALPAPIYFRSAPMPADGIYPTHNHPWGEFVYAVNGVVELQFAGGHYLVPPQFGIWLPPDIEHLGQTHKEAWHSSVYVSAPLCVRLPTQVTALGVTPLVREMLEHLRQHPPALPPLPSEQRFLQVLVDLLETAERMGSYLPASDDAALARVLALLERDPGDNRSVAALARHARISERTLMRRCQRDLGMTFAEWRQRLRVVKAMPMLADGRTVEGIAFDLGYASSSAFITMFRRMTGETPDEYRRRVPASR